MKLKDLQFLIYYLKKSKKRFILLFVLYLFTNLIILPNPAITGYIIDHVFISKDASLFNLLLFALVVLLVISNISNIFREYQMFRLRQDLSYSIRLDLFEKLLRFPMKFHNDYQTGYLVSRVDEVTQVGNFFSTSIITFIGFFIKLVGALVFLFNYNAKLTLIALISMPFFFRLSMKYSHQIRYSTKETIEKDARLREKIQESFTGIEVIKAFAGEMKKTEEIEKKMDDLKKSEIKLTLADYTSAHLLEMVSALNLLIILWVSGYEIFAGRLSVGNYVAFIGYLSFLYSPLQFIAIFYINIQRYLVACKRVSELFNMTTERDDKKKNIKPKMFKGEVIFHKVFYSYDGKNVVLDDVNLHIKPGEKIAFLGQSGAGKTTLMNLMLGFYYPVNGNIRFDGIDIETINLEALRSHIGVVSQNVFLFNDTIFNNIKYGRPEASFQEVMEAAQKSGIHHFIADLENGYETKVGEIGKKLSGGQRQRISIARVLLRNPDLVIFDEPTSSLDNISSKALFDLLKSHLWNRTCIFISHRLNELEWVDRIFVLKDRRIVQSGTHQELINQEGHYKELYNYQISLEMKSGD
ncbi:MAG TPA: ABC transporter ATP-binding protein [Candidatus Kapabacteria bacterium]|nr:ABC transporter ATP-binding protein [Candidatus Kapabacteria bacterium]